MSSSKKLLNAPLLFLLLICSSLFAQNTPFVVVTTRHIDLNKTDGSYDEWLKLEKEFFDKVISKNEMIKGAAVYQHRYTPDNSEIVFVRLFDNWNDIEASNQIEDKLVKDAWPDEASGKSFFDKLDSYYTTRHTDEIYSMVPGAKMLAVPPTKDMVLYVQVHEMKPPMTGFMDNFKAVSELMGKNEVVKAYYPHRHRWGSNSNDFVEAFIFSSIADMDNFRERSNELMKEMYPDESARNEMQKKLNGYFTGHHSDYIYSVIPELFKSSIAAK